MAFTLESERSFCKAFLAKLNGLDLLPVDAVKAAAVKDVKPSKNTANNDDITIRAILPKQGRVSSVTAAKGGGLVAFAKKKWGIPESHQKWVKADGTVIPASQLSKVTVASLYVVSVDPKEMKEFTGLKTVSSTTSSSSSNTNLWSRLEARLKKEFPGNDEKIRTIIADFSGTL